MADASVPLREMLDLDVLEEDRFLGRSYGLPPERLFGGQIVAQALIAAGRTVEIGRANSLHGYFLRKGDSRKPVRYEIERIRDRRTFSTRRVSALQQDRPIACLECSFHVDEPGLVHQDTIPEVARPEDLVRVSDEPKWLRTLHNPGLFAGLDLAFAERSHGFSPGIDPDGENPASSSEPGRTRLWWRSRERLGDNPLLHVGLIAYVSDLALQRTVFSRHGLNNASPGVTGASLDHSLWFHRPCRADEWLLYDIESPVASGARGLGIGAIYSDDGLRVATVVQEGFLRPPPLR